MKSENLHRIILLLTIPAALFLFYPSFDYYFFQDDWFVLNWVQNNSPLSFFAPRSDIIYWRPISMPVLFYLASRLFGLTPVAFHLMAFSIFLILIFFVYKLLNALGLNQKLSALGAFLYGTWPVHFISLSWFSTTSYIIGPLLQILSSLFFLKFSKTGDNKSYFFCLIFFLTALASSEFTLVLPAIFITYLYLKSTKFRLKYFIPFLLIDLLYLFIRFILIPIPAKGDYEPVISVQVLNNYIWYLLWGLNFPEAFKYLIYFSHPKESFKNLLDFWQVAVPAIALFFWTAKIILFKIRKESKILLFGAIWFFVGLIPVGLLVNHSYPLYLSFSGLGIIFVLMHLFQKMSKVQIIVTIILWLTSAYSTLSFTGKNHWIKNEQSVAKAYINYVVTKHPNPPKESVFIFRPPNIAFARNHDIVIPEQEETLKLSLSDQNAMQVIFSDPTVKSIYLTHQETVSLPEGVPVFEISPIE